MSIIKITADVHVRIQYCIL